MAAPRNWIGIRIRLVGLCFLAVFALIVARAFQLQVLDQDEWRKRADRQHQRIIPLTPQRGTIYDRNGEELALSLEVDSIFVEPGKITDPDAAARSLATALSLPTAAVRAKLQSPKKFLWLKRQVSERESQGVREMKIEGISAIKEHRRYYPNSELGAQVIGFTGLDPEGLEGIELAYNSVIMGQGGYLVTERDALGRGLGPGSPVIEGGQGYNLHLTLDKNLQYVVEKELAAGVRQSRAKAGTAILLEPATGRVLAMASQPDFNPNAVNKYRPSQWRNRAICDTYEPGSTFKPFLLAAAFNEKLIRPEQKIFCENGSFRVGGKTIHDHHGHGHLSVTEILKYSSNIGMAKIAKIVERERFHRYITAFGFGASTRLGLPGEVGGMVRNPARWFEIDLAAIGFGQGISVTPIQLASATAAIANGGNLMAPYLVERVVDQYGQEVEAHTPVPVRQVISDEVARLVRQIMVESTAEGGTGTLAAVPGYTVGGKTGTAQKVDPVTGGYSVDKRMASFVGFVPAEAPRLVILIVIDEPVGQVYGGLVAAPVFSRIASQALRYLNVPPTQPIPQMALAELAEAARKAESSQAAVTAEGANEIFSEGEIVDPAEMEGAEPPVEIALRMPDFTGMSFRQVLQMMEKTGLNVRLNGSGRVVEQNPLPGQQVKFGNEVWVRFAAPS